MLKKLYKHEFYSLFRNMIPIYAALILFAVLSKLSTLTQADGLPFSILRGLSFTVYIFSIIAVFAVGMVIVITRFYKNLLSHEGYLTFTLPFSAHQHIICKLVCGMTVMIINSVMFIISLLVFVVGTEAGKELSEILGTLIGEITSLYSVGRIIFVAAEILLLILISTAQGLLMFYASMAIGQQFRSKIGASIVAYIALYTAVEIITMTIMLPSLLRVPDELNNYVISGISEFQLFLLFPIIFSLVLSLVYYFITTHFLSKKLNLE